MTVPMSGADRNTMPTMMASTPIAIQMITSPASRAAKAKPKSRTPAMIRKMPAMMLMVAVAAAG